MHIGLCRYSAVSGIVQYLWYLLPRSQAEMQTKITVSWTAMKCCSQKKKRNQSKCFPRSNVIPEVLPTAEEAREYVARDGYDAQMSPFSSIMNAERSHNIFASVSSAFSRASAAAAALCISHRASGSRAMMRRDVLDPSGRSDRVLVLTEHKTHTRSPRAGPVGKVTPLQLISLR